MAPPINKSGAMPNSSWELETFKYNPFRAGTGYRFAVSNDYMLATEVVGLENRPNAAFFKFHQRTF